ncbi:hypothetical protein J1N35_040460 [Gossypium stocksii]|uniref:RNase H type-1 domain-containing protein n=1 Tax=Gossypium stocksii TaxID=47602 RepID=A0A9D3UDL1_9ROSI|nr:hypothetical protein J1N35_040460 [Gossypium stocksii]
MGLDLKLMDTEVEGDACSITKKLLNEREDKSEIGALVRDGECLGKQFRACIFKYCPRTVNDVVHLLAAEGLKTREQWCLRDGGLEFARETVERDRRGLSCEGSLVTE